MYVQHHKGQQSRNGNKNYTEYVIYVWAFESIFSMLNCIWCIFFKENLQAISLKTKKIKAYSFSYPGGLCTVYYFAWSFSQLLTYKEHLGNHLRSRLQGFSFFYLHLENSFHVKNSQKSFILYVKSPLTTKIDRQRHTET